MITVALAGGPCSGKTTLARNLTTYLCTKRDPQINAQHVTEFARDYIDTINRKGGFTPSVSNQFLFFLRQKEREERLSKEDVEILITDSPIFINFAFLYPICNSVEEKHQYLYLYEKYIIEDEGRYDHIFVLPPQYQFFNDGTRSETEKEAERIHLRIAGFLTYHNLHYRTIAGDDPERMNQILDYIL